MKRIFETTLAGRKLVVETGELAQLCNASVLIKYGDTVVLSTVTASDKPRDDVDYFPLSVDYQERLYSVGKIPGGFIKREGRPTENAVLAGRAIDRPLRPLFPDDLRNEVTLVNTVLCVEQDNQPEITSFIGSAIALGISDVPFNGPTAAVMLGIIGEEIIINPTVEQRSGSLMQVMLAGTKNKITMIEAAADQVPEDLMIKAISKGHEVIKELCTFIKNITGEVGRPKFDYCSTAVPGELFDEVYSCASEKMTAALFTFDKNERDVNVTGVIDEVKQYFTQKYGEALNSADLDNALYKLQKKIVRNKIYSEGKRVDGRTLDEIRPLSGNVGFLPRTHGSGLFQRGSTQVLTILTLGPLAEVQRLDGLELAEEEKRYIHHYNFPGFSVGDSKPSRGPGRREIGHGALAEKALLPVIPSEEDFPYAFRLVSEVLMSNGSTSQGSVCGSTLALMDAGVPIKDPVAGISAGMVTDEASDAYVQFIDIQGIEDFFGDMDFKVAGTKNGITAIQVDIKTDGLSLKMIEEAFAIARKGINKIIDEVILPVIPEPRKSLSVYAPKIFQMTINPDKIRDVIGSGGKVINKIISDTGVKIDIEDDGRVFITSSDEEAVNRSRMIIKGITEEPEPGQIYDATVTKIMEFGAFVEYLPGKEGLVHISKLDKKRVNKVTDVVKMGDRFKVKVLEIDKQGRVNLSRKDAMTE